jgi:hypothetical protein
LLELEREIRALRDGNPRYIPLSPSRRLRPISTISSAPTGSDVVKSPKAASPSRQKAINPIDIKSIARSSTWSARGLRDADTASVISVVIPERPTAISRRAPHPRRS